MSASQLASPLQALALIQGAARLSPFDLGLVAVYLIAITLFGLRFREKKSADGKAPDKSLKSYFLANNTIPWWAIALSIVSAETSTLTIISVPGIAFAGNFGFLQLVIGYMLGRIVVALLFLPRYFAGEMLTAYQLIDRRFGPVLHKVTAGLFLLTRAAAEGVRVFAVSIVVGIAIGTKDVLSIGIISALTLLYTFEGGMTAVIWTDVVQMVIYVAGTLIAVFTLGSHTPGGWSHITQVASAAGKFHMLDFTLNLTSTYTFWAGVLGGTFLTMASHGTDQLMVQRMLAARNLRESRLALLSSGAVIFMQFTLFLLIGAGLYVFYAAPDSEHMLGQHPWIHTLTPDRIFPTFIVHEMPIGIAGLLVAAILAAAMSNLSAALNSLSSTTVVDFYMRLRPQADADERGLISKSSTVLWALVLFAIAVYSAQVGGKGHVVEIGLIIASVAYGCLLGVFLLGTLTKFATQWGAATGMIIGFTVNIALWKFPGRVLWHFVSLDNLGRNRSPMPDITIPHIAYPWYTLIGAVVTFAIGTLFSLVFRKQSKRVSSLPATVAVILSVFFLLTFRGAAQEPAVRSAPAKQQRDPHRPGRFIPLDTDPDFSEVSQLINDAIAAHKLPGAVVAIGHNGRVVFHHAYGNRKLDREPGLDAKPSPAEPMTEDTVFDMASLTKCLATATAVMQLYQQGKIASFDDSVEKYLPAFNESHDAARGKVTLRMLLTHFSGEAPDVSLKDPWGLTSPDRNEGLHRAFTSALSGTPGAKFVYSDINFILLGALIERLSGQREDDYVVQHIYKPLGMAKTRYLPLDRASCKSKDEIVGAAIGTIPRNAVIDCLVEEGKYTATWIPYQLLPNIAPTTHDDEGKSATTNPHFDMLTRGTVHDPTTRRMGGIAGHAGLFSTAHDVSLYAQALLEKLRNNTGPFPLKQSTLQLMTQPGQPGHLQAKLVEANKAQQASVAAGEAPSLPGLAPNYPAVKNQSLRGFGWDIDTAFSKPRGAVFPIGSFGHTGFTGTSLWIDPASDTYVILLANAIHPRGGAPISNLRGQVATAAAYALRLDAPSKNFTDPSAVSKSTATLTGIDVLESTHFAALKTLATAHENRLRIGLLTNQSGLNRDGHRTVDILHSLTTNNIELKSLFSPEHGIFGKQDTTSIAAETDTTTGLHVISLYGTGSASRHPTHEQLKDLDALVIDLQDAGVHFWTYESVLGYFLEAAAAEQHTFQHRLDIVVLDRPNPIGGLAVQGPLVDSGRESYVGYMPLPVRHGMTYGELARYINAYKGGPDGKSLNASLTVIEMQNWSRGMFFADTGQPWTNPSPNLRSPYAAIRYPALGLIETTNISVGRGSTSPFSFFGAGIPTKDAKTGEQKPVWFKGADVAAGLNKRQIAGVTFEATTEAIIEDANKYPFHGQTIEAVRVNITDRDLAATPEIGIEILSVLHKLYPEQFHLEGAMRLLLNQASMDALERGDDPRDISASWKQSLDAFKANRQKILLY